MSEKYPSKLPPCVRVPLDQCQLEDIYEKATEWALFNGVTMRSKINFLKDVVEVAPLCVLPSTFPKDEFEKGARLQTILNELMHRVTQNRQFLTNNLKDTIKVDEFTAKLFRIYETVMDEGLAQTVSLGIFRSDYMLHSGSLKQVEMNTIAASFAGLATSVTKYHRYILQELGYMDKVGHLPENNALTGLSEGILEAWKLYGDEKAAILFLVDDISYNICDQKSLEFEIKKLNPTVKILRRTLQEVQLNGCFQHNGIFSIDSEHVGVIYFRCGYDPSQYRNEQDWEARLNMERSRAIKCPSIQYHLAGTKKIQQALAERGALELFFSKEDETEKIKAIREVFMGLHGLEFGGYGDEAFQMGLDDPERFVLKPQREGGGNNVYGKIVRDLLLDMRESKDRLAWILMERIHPPVIQGYILRAGLKEIPLLTSLVSELGIYGVIITDSQNVITNKQVGHMLRTKPARENEGGVLAGVGALDSPFLIE